MKKIFSLSLLLSFFVMAMITNNLYSVQQSISPTNHNLISIKKIIPNIVLDIRYATKNNFTGKPVYSSADCFIRKEVGLALKKAQDKFNVLGLGLKVWDAYRPRSAQYIFWDLVPDPRYVADPSKGSRHNSGAAVDVTLVDLKTGNEVPMPTEFDNFTERAWRNYNDLPEEVIKNRQILEDIMHECGFFGLSTEWWHFDYNGWEKFDYLDIPFEDLKDK